MPLSVTVETLHNFQRDYGCGIRRIPATEIAFTGKLVDRRSKYPDSRLYPGCIIEVEEQYQRRATVGIPAEDGTGNWLICEESGSRATTGCFRVIPLTRITEDLKEVPA